MKPHIKFYKNLRNFVLMPGGLYPRLEGNCRRIVDSAVNKTLNFKLLRFLIHMNPPRTPPAITVGLSMGNRGSRTWSVNV